MKDPHEVVYEADRALCEAIYDLSHDAREIQRHLGGLASALGRLGMTAVADELREIGHDLTKGATKVQNLHDLVGNARLGASNHDIAQTLAALCRVE